MKYTYTLLSSLVILIFSVGCNNRQSRLESFSQAVYSPSVSTGFEIKKSEDSDNILIVVKNPWQGASNINKEFLIVTDSVVPKNFEGQYILGDVERIVCMSSTHIAMLDALGATDKIVGVSGLPYISNQYIQQNADKIPDVGYEGNMNYEALLASKPDIVLLFSINGASALERKLEEFGIPYLYIADYVEEDPLGKAEWIIPMAQIIGKRESGVDQFKQIAQRYDSLKNKIKELDEEKPKVMVNAPFADAWFMPSSSSYVAKMIEDAGGEYVYKKDTGSTSKPIDLEQAYIMLSNSDFWINTGNYSSLEELKSALPKLKESGVLDNIYIYNNNKISSPGGGNDCYESGVMNPDLILRDLIKIFHPGMIEEDFTYYHRFN